MTEGSPPAPPGPAPDSEPDPRAGRRGGKRRSLVRGSAIAVVASAFSIVASLLLDVVVAAKFGATSATDTFWVAARLPIAITAIVMVGGNQALVPAISTWTAQRGRRTADHLTTALFLAATVLGVGIGLLIAVFAEPLVRITAPGLSTREVHSAAPMLRVMAISVPLTISAEVLRALLNSRYSFGAPAAMTAVRSAVAAAWVIAVGGDDITVVAWAFVAGALGQILFLAVTAVWIGFRPGAGEGMLAPEVRAAGRLSVRPLAGATLNPLARIVEQITISFLPPGSITLLNYAYRLISAIGGSVFFRSVIVVIVPRLTEATAMGREREAARMTRHGITLMLAIAVPLTMFMAALAQPATQGFFHRGNFDLSDAQLLGTTLFVYAFSLVGSGVQRALLAPFFSRLDTHTPLLNTIYGVVANIALLLVLVVPFRGNADVAVVGVALAYSLSQYVNVGHAWYRLRTIMPKPFSGTGAFTIRLTIATAISGVVVFAARELLLGAGRGTAFLVIGSMVAAGVGLLILVGVFLLIARDDAARIRAELAGREPA